MINRYINYPLFVLLLLNPTLLMAEELTHDPFTRPALTALATPSVDEKVIPAVVEVPWMPALSAVMLAGAQSLITIDGEVMKLGEKKEGYQLVEIHEREAVFVKSGKKR